MQSIRNDQRPHQRWHLAGALALLSMVTACDGTIFGGSNDTQIAAAKHCGNGVCSANEDCESCAEDCGVCPEVTCSDDTCSGVYLVSQATTRKGIEDGSWQDTTAEDGTVHSVTEQKVGKNYRLEQSYTFQRVPSVSDARLTLVASAGPSGESISLQLKRDGEWRSIGEVTGEGYTTIELGLNLATAETDEEDDEFEDVEIRFIDAADKDRNEADTLAIDYLAIVIGDQAAPVCGDNVCDSTEDCANCEADCDVCPATCGDDFCDDTEDCSSCESDCGACPAACGDAVCDISETCMDCESDCGVCPPVCGDNTCEGGEDCSSCAADCGACAPVCGDNVCEGGEDCTNCEVDCGVCPPTCGNGTCDSDEDCASCPGDCGECAPVCGDNVCEGGEDCANCESDCGVCAPVCGDKVCDVTERCSSCPGDCGVCPPVCGDNVCEGNEDCASCESDCGSCGPTCDEPVASVPSGKHNAGAACRNCHTGSIGPNFPIAGTLYDSITGTNPVVGATITAVDASGKELKMVTAQNGNFWTTSAVAFPVQVRASSCPKILPMGSPVTESAGDCNSCHSSSFRVYLK